MDNKEKLLIARIVVSAVLLILTLFSFLNDLAKLIMNIVAFVIISYDILIELVVGIFKKEFESEKFLMLIASIGAFCINEYHEAVAVMLLYQLGEFLQDKAVDKSKDSIVKLMDIRPDYANVIRDGNILKVSPQDVKVGETIIIYAGEKISLDGKILEGSTSLDTSALTGESLPADVTEGDNVLSGSVNLTGTIKVEVTTTYGESTVAKIIEIVSNSEKNQAKSQKFISKFAKIYTPVVVGLAVLIAILPPIIIGGEWFTWLERALMMLVISCPCALVISIPLTFFAGIGGASRNGILVKGANFIEALSKCTCIAFDKTGTLTKGNFKVTKVIANGVSEDELLELAAAAETESSHPIAMAIKNEIKTLSKLKPTSTSTLAGFGVKAIINKKTILVGSFKLMQESSIEAEQVDDTGTIIYIAREQDYLGAIVIEDEIKETAIDGLAALKNVNVNKTLMLTGDKKSVAYSVAEKLKIDDCYYELLPEDKAKILAETKNNNKGKIAFIGDGINDAPAFKTADIGIAMGLNGSDVAVEAADVLVMNDDLNKLSTMIKQSQKTMRIAKQNIIFSIAFKVLMLTLGAFGLINMWLAVLADVGVALLAVLNALRAMRKIK